MVPVARERVWEVLIDPQRVAEFTPFVSGITPRGETHWIWNLTGIQVAGKGFSFTFTERMTLDSMTRIEFTHDPPAGERERAGVHGWYALSDAAPPPGSGASEAVELETSLEICVDLPLPRLSGPAVRATMKGVMAQMGDRFSKNLLRHLGVD